ncbi:hypothetical protein U1Q18_001890 [Sarracenia purpurea var. burkii]
MRLWRRASGALKDQNSILIASLARRTALRNPDIEAAVIKATSHDESRVDYKSASTVFKWIRTSPAYLRPFVRALCVRMERTRSWVVALKGLILMHGVFCCKVPAMHKMGRLPFDLSNFKDGHASPSKMWGYNAFVRAYYAYLDQKSAVICMDLQERNARILETIDQTPMEQELGRLQKTQALFDLLLQIKPQADGMIRALIFEAMDCIIIEIYDIYSRICNGIARVLGSICSAGKVEATVALKVLQKAVSQGEELSLYLEFCRDIGVLNAKDCPRVERIPEEGIRELQRIINGDSEKTEMEDKAIVVSEAPMADDQKDSRSNLKTVITNNWEVFDEDLIQIVGEDDSHEAGRRIAEEEDPFAASLIPFLQVQPYGNNQELPDLISFL